MCAPTNHNSRAQASIETLLVFLIFLSAFGIAYAASSRLASAAQARLDTSLSQAAFTDFSSKLSSACSLGNGNVREVEIKGKPATLSLAGGEPEPAARAPESGGSSVIFTAGGFSAAANSSCEISLATGAPSSFFRMENKEGMIEISGTRPS